MQTAPAGYETEWEEAVRDLKPFATLVYVSKGEGASSDTYDLADFIELSCVKTLYGNFSFGNAASSQVNGKSHVYKAEIGDKLRISLRPASSSAGAQVWYGHFIVNAVVNDSYTGICTFTAVDAITFYGDIMWHDDDISYMDYIWTTDVAIKCASFLGILLGEHNFASLPLRTLSVFIAGKTCREVLQRLAVTYGDNVIVKNDGTLAFIRSAGSIYNKTVFQINIGTRAEKIVYNGTWNGYEYNLKTEILREAPDGTAISYEYPAHPEHHGFGGNIPYASSSGTMLNPIINPFHAIIENANIPFQIDGEGGDELVPYSAFTAENIVITPLIELGDTAIAQVSSQKLYGIIGKITVDFRAPQIATIESPPPVS